MWVYLADLASSAAGAEAGEQAEEQEQGAGEQEQGRSLLILRIGTANCELQETQEEQAGPEGVRKRGGAPGEQGAESRFEGIEGEKGLCITVPILYRRYFFVF